MRDRINKSPLSITVWALGVVFAEDSLPFKWKAGLLPVTAGDSLEKPFEEPERGECAANCDTLHRAISKTSLWFFFFFFLLILTVRKTDVSQVRRARISLQTLFPYLLELTAEGNLKGKMEVERKAEQVTDLPHWSHECDFYPHSLNLLSQLLKSTAELNTY